MTVVAAFKYLETPVLFGDFMISVNGSRSGLRRKLFKFSDNFVAGWTGSMVSAATVFSDLYERFGNTTPTFVDLQNFLSTHTFATSPALELAVIGWLVDSSPHCFCWWNNYPTIVHENVNYFFGSGGSSVQRLVEKPGHEWVVGLEDERSQVDLATYFTVNVAGRLLADELFEQENQKNLFGVAYEALVYDGAFNYIDDVLYTFCDYSTADIQRVVNPNYFKLNHLGEVAAVQQTNVVKDATGIDLITPVFDLPAAQNEVSKFTKFIKDTRRTKPFSVTSRYYCIAYRLSEGEGSVFPGAVVSREAGLNQPITVKRLDNEREELTIKITQLHQLITAHRAINSPF